MSKKQINEKPCTKVEAYGVKGMRSVQWRKVFKNFAALDKWASANSAEVLGVRSVGKEEWL